LADSIFIKGAGEHNLKHIDVRLPKREISVITGVSGSGKSTLAFDVLYSEGQRRYVECVSSYAKQFLERVPRPKVDSIEGLCPALAIRSTGGSRSARSTVGTSTEIYDYLRLLFARIGLSHCTSCGEPVSAEAAKEIAGGLLRTSGKRLLVSFPLETGDRPAREIADDLVSQGFLRVYHRGKVISLEEKAPSGAGEILVIVDRLKLREGLERRLIDSLELAFSRGRGTLYIIEEGCKPRRYTKGLSCDRCGARCEPPTPLLFSFNSPAGACPKCRGFGDTLEFNLDLIIPDKNKTLREGAVTPWWGKYKSYFLGKLRKLDEKGVIRLDVPFKKLNADERDVVLHGCRGLTGILTMLERFKAKSYKKTLRFMVKKYQMAVRCLDCGGTRLRPESLSVKLGGQTIADVSSKTIEDALDWVRDLELSAMERAIGERVLEEISSRLSLLISLGAGYLTLDRLTRSLSSGELQRIELAGALGSRLADTLYVLDEPTVGLHPRDTARLVSALKGLKESGNTVVVVEHDRDVILAADWAIDLGPDAGRDGGDVVCQCPPAELQHHEESRTGRHLAAGVAPVNKAGGTGRGGARIEIKGAKAHNLKSIDVSIPLQKMISVSGVSGAGKSSLVEDVLFAQSLSALGRPGPPPVYCDRISGLKGIDDVVMVDRSPIGKTPRSSAVTYLKAFDAIRKIFAATPEAKANGFTPGTFSFNTAGGRCESCKGEGRVKVEMYFLADLYLDCEECGGARYTPEVLAVKFKGKSVKDVLDITVDEAISLFSDLPEVGAKLWLLQRVGLGYLSLGQPATTLSGGEAQRVKIARELSRGRGKHVLYILDEPTIGLHFADVERLVSVLRELVDRGNTVLMVEHNLDVIAMSDYVIDLGPGAGDRDGGYLVAQGPPGVVADCEGSFTGGFLRGAGRGTSKRRVRSDAH
jgi:excinuclease ABC subunit A